MPVSYRSSLLGVLDLAYSLYLRARQPKTHYWFSTGYGDLQSYYDLVDRMMAEWKRDGLKRYLGGVPLQVSWQPVDSGDLAVLCDEGCFASPLAASLPEEVRTARFLFVRAAPGGPLPPTRCVVVHTAATGVVDYEGRDAQLARPLLEHGIASAILMAPYNGSRAPAAQDGHYIDNVADYMLQSLAIILEGAALLRWLDKGFAVLGRSEHPAPLKLGVAGLSWGGAMAACIALGSKLRVACMVGLGSDSPRVMATGCISWQLDWEALQRDRGHTREEAQREIEAVFTRITFAHLVAAADGPSIGAMVQVVAADDHYVYAAEGVQLHASLARAVVPGRRAELRWADGGHATGFVRQRQLFVPAVVDAVEGLA